MLQGRRTANLNSSMAIEELETEQAEDEERLREIECG
jgi:hypothetical protein